MKSLLWIWSVPLDNSISSMFVGSWKEEDLYTWRLLGQEERGVELELYRKLSLIISVFSVALWCPWCLFLSPKSF